MSQLADWEELDDLLQTVQRHQYRRSDVELLEQVRRNLAYLRHATTVQQLQQDYSRGRA